MTVYDLVTLRSCPPCRGRRRLRARFSDTHTHDDVPLDEKLSRRWIDT